MNAPEAKQRYLAKIQICGRNPYEVATNTTEVPLNVGFAEIYNYMVVEPNPYTGAPKDSMKGMQANLWFQQGWVKEVTGKRLNDVYVVHGKVLHSFSLRKTPLKPWILINNDGKILAAHCDCAIGLLEACSHVGATLFALDDVRRKVLEQKISVTDLPAYWNKPPITAEQNLYRKVRDMSFGRKIRRFWGPVPQPVHEQYSELLNKIQEGNVFIAAMHSFCGTGTFTCVACKDAADLQDKYKEYDMRNEYEPTYRTESKAVRYAIVLSSFENMANDPVKLAEIRDMTARQSESKHWLMFRIGRITASVFKEACRTKIHNPSISLIKKICYNQNSTLKTAAVSYGKNNESRAYDTLFSSVMSCHKNARQEQCGLLISQEYPCLGASPDGIIYCDCHGMITVEIKCPYSGKINADFTDTLIKMKDPFLQQRSDGEILLNTKHKYFYQAFMQVYIANANFGYFFVWSPRKQYLFEIKRNDEFWEACRSRAIIFYKEVILPELLYKGFTNPL